MLFSMLKWLHILSAFVAVGSNLTYAVWLGYAGRHPESMAFTLRGTSISTVAWRTAPTARCWVPGS